MRKLAVGAGRIAIVNSALPQGRRKVWWVRRRVASLRLR